MLGDRLSKLRMRERVGLLLAVIAVALLLMDNLVVQPVAKEYKNLGAAIAAERAKLAYAETVVTLESQIMERFGAVKDLLGAPQPEVVSVDLMKGRIDELAKKSEVLLFSIKHRPVKDMGFYQEFAVEIGEFEATEDNLLRFLHSIRTEESIYRVSKLDVKPDPEGDLVRGSMMITKVAMAPEMT